MAQIGEKVKGLTDGTYAELDKSANLNNFRYFRNMIDHSYENVNRVMLQAYVQQVSSNMFYAAVKNRVNYCFQNKKK